MKLILFNMNEGVKIFLQYNNLYVSIQWIQLRGHSRLTAPKVTDI